MAIKVNKIEVFNHEDDGYQIIYINGQFDNALHFNDDQIGYSVERLLRRLGCDVNWLHHNDIPNEYREFLIKHDYLDEEE